MKNLIRVFCITILLFVFSVTVLPSQLEPIFIGLKTSLNSKVLGEKRELQIYLPESYDSSANRRYPVLYVIAGQRYFLHGISYQQSLTFPNYENDWFDHTPDFIVVGLVTHTPERSKLFIARAGEYIEHLRKEVIPYIENNFRTTKERNLFGWEIAAGLVTSVLANAPDIFDGYIAVSPSFISDENLNKIQLALDAGKLHGKRIYFSRSPAEYWVTRGTDKLKSILEKASKNLLWKYDVLNGETHYSTSNPGFYYGLRTIFGDYEPIRYDTIKEFENAGGLAGLAVHYKARGERYHVSHSIVINAEGDQVVNVVVIGPALHIYFKFCAWYPNRIIKC